MTAPELQGTLQIARFSSSGFAQYHNLSLTQLEVGFHDVPDMLPTKQIKFNDIVGSAKAGNRRACLWLCSPGKDARCDRVIMGRPRRDMMNRPGSATISKPPIAPSTPVQYQTRGPDTETKGSLGTKLRKEKIPCLSLDHYRSDPARVEWRSLEDSDLSPLAKEEVSTSSMWRALRPWICSRVGKTKTCNAHASWIAAYIIFTSRGDVSYLSAVR